MSTKEVIVFRPLFFERVWGGRRLEQLYGKPLPADVPIGESWEVVDRPEAESVVAGGDFDGAGLHELWTARREEVFGADYAGHAAARFPLLVKLLDAREKLSVQVHPPARATAELGGEPKTEMWHVLDAGPDADIFAGLRAGVTRAEFERALGDGTVADCIHRIPTNAGDTIFIPSGRIHAIGADNVILEVQQNSDTTYRVFDWNRAGLDGLPRTLHIDESLRSTDFDDFEPKLAENSEGVLVDDPLFLVERIGLDEPVALAAAGRFTLAACIGGAVSCGGRELRAGDFFLVPASAGPTPCASAGDTRATIITISLPADTEGKN